MRPGQSKVAQKIDALMEQASESLVERRYFECERLCVDALRRAIASLDFDRVARIVLPLQEARRQIRDMAIGTGRLVPVNGEIPSGEKLEPGMYLIGPPRVGVDGRLLREEALRREIPVMVLVREPTTRQGLWPIVAVGPVTVRTRISPPPAASLPDRASSRAGRAIITGGAGAAETEGAAAGMAAGGKGKKSRGAKDAQAAAATAGKPAAEALQFPASIEWLLVAAESLGDEAIESVPPALSPMARVLALAERLEAVPDHEKLHQRLEEAAREAAKIPAKKRAALKPGELEPGMMPEDE